MSEMPTLCINCHHHRCLHDGSAHGPSRNTWYYHVCVSESVAVLPRPNYVTGEIEREHTYCRDINRDGLCEHYEAAR